MRFDARTPENGRHYGTQTWPAFITHCGPLLPSSMNQSERVMAIQEDQRHGVLEIKVDGAGGRCSMTRGNTRPRGWASPWGVALHELRAEAGQFGLDGVGFEYFDGSTPASEVFRDR